MDCEILLAPHTAARGEKMLVAMAEAAANCGVRTILTNRWKRAAPILMSYGLGHPERRPWTDRHKQEGGRLIGWDLGYWNRDVPLDFNMRLTIDDDHPHRWISDMPADRFQRSGIELRDDSNPDGPIILCGLGDKQRRFLGLKERQWEMSKLADLKRRFPGRQVIYRPKRFPEKKLGSCPTQDGPIHDGLKGASLCVVRHSNVAVDACIAGIPVECEDGAAFALYQNGRNPSRSERLRFLQNLAYWQWTTKEVTAAWSFIKTKLSA